MIYNEIIIHILLYIITLRAEIICGSWKVYFLSFLVTKMAQLFNIFPLGGQGPIYHSCAIPWLLVTMHMRRKDLGLQQPWYRPSYNDVTGGFPSQRPVTQNFDIFFDLRLNKRLRKQSRRPWFETPSGSLWHHCNDSVSAPEGLIFLYGIIIRVVSKRIVNKSCMWCVWIFCYERGWS